VRNSLKEPIRDNVPIAVQFLEIAGPNRYEHSHVGRVEHIERRERLDVDQELEDFQLFRHWSDRSDRLQDKVDDGIAPASTDINNPKKFWTETTFWNGVRLG
jgi:hypothetical protein